MSEGNKNRGSGECGRADATDREPIKLNLGSGDTPKRGFINFDATIFRRPKQGTQTDVVGRIEAMPFKPESFDQIFSAHVIEHFYYKDSIKMLYYCYGLLKIGGVAIIEGPCILGGYDYYITRKNDLDAYIRMLYGLGPIARKKYGDELAQHRSGWTGPVLAREMEAIGYYIEYVGHGRSHGMGKRDFRVEGRKS